MAEAQLRQYFSRSPKRIHTDVKTNGQEEPPSVLLTPEHTPVKDEDTTTTHTPCHHTIVQPKNQRKTRQKALHFNQLSQDSGSSEDSSEVTSETEGQGQPREVMRSLCRSNSDSVLDSPKPTKAKLVRCEVTAQSQNTEVKTSTRRPPKPGKPTKAKRASKKNNPGSDSGSSSTENSKHRSRSVPPKKIPVGGNHLVTDYFIVRKSSRVPHSLLKKKEQSDLEEAILSHCEDGLKIVDLPGKGRGVVATKVFRKGDFVVEYHGDLITTTAAKKREQKYANNSDIGCYMYYFAFQNKTYCIDATAESGKLGRLLNHSKALANCTTRVVPIYDRPYLIIVAARDLNVGEELLYDYGDRSKTSLESHPWLAS